MSCLLKRSLSLSTVSIRGFQLGWAGLTSVTACKFSVSPLHVYLYHCEDLCGAPPLCSESLCSPLCVLELFTVAAWPDSSNGCHFETKWLPLVASLITHLILPFSICVTFPNNKRDSFTTEVLIVGILCY